MERLLLRGFMHRYRDRLWCVIIASVLLNILVFAGSAYSMLVYDSIIPSGSIPTLIALFGILVVVYLFQFTFETLRSEAMLGVANGVHRDLSGRVQHAVVSRALKAGGVPGDGLQPIRDLDQIHAFLSSAGPIALIDLPWVIVFLIVLTLLALEPRLTALLGASSWRASPGGRTPRPRPARAIWPAPPPRGRAACWPSCATRKRPRRWACATG